MAETQELLEIDAILDVLDDEVSAVETRAELGRRMTGRRGTAAPVLSRPAEPPRIPLPQATAAPATRAAFPELFQPPPPRPATRPVSPDEKVEDMRRQLKFAEGQLGRFREAWSVREGEMDVLEAALAAERARAEAATAEAQRLEQFLARKQRELEQYGESVAQIVAQKEAREKELREQLDRERRTMREELAKHHAAVREMAKVAEAQRLALARRTKELGEMESSRGSEVAELLEDREELIRRLESALQTEMSRALSLEEKLDEQKEQIVEIDELPEAVYVAPEPEELLEAIARAGRAVTVAARIVEALRADPTQIDDQLPRLERALSIAGECLAAWPD